MGLIRLIIAVVSFIMFVSILLSIFVTGFTPGNTGILLVFFIVIAMCVVPHSVKGLFPLVVLLLIAWFLYFGASNYLEGLGRKIPNAVKDAARKNLDNAAQGTAPGLLNQLTQKSQDLDQNTVNECLMDKAAEAMKSNPNLGIGQKVANCRAQVGAAFETCMKNNVFNGNVPGEVQDCDPGEATKWGHLLLATLYVGVKQATGGVCAAEGLANTHIPRVHLPPLPFCTK
jgi:hypothetical protein